MEKQYEIQRKQPRRKGEQRILFGGVFVLSAQERDSLFLLISYFHSYCFV